MKETFQKTLATSLSGILLALSVGVIFWISRDEQGRLAEREQAALEAARLSSEAEARERISVETHVDSAEAADRTFHDIDALLASLGSDDVPDEGE